MTRAELHFISGGISGGAFMAAAVSVHPWADYLHLRDKAASAKDLAALADALLAAGVPASKLIVNDRVDVALAVGAAGVQLAWNSLGPQRVKERWPTLRVGCSVHAPEEAAEAFRQGADYVLFGHLYDTASKPGLPGKGLAPLAEAVRLAAGPVIALGGIKPGHIPGIMETGAAGYAVLSGIGAAPDPAEAARGYRRSEPGGTAAVMRKGGDS